MKSKIKMIVWPLSSLLLLSAGCQNHIRNIETQTPENLREVSNSEYLVTMDKETPDGPSFQVSVEKSEMVKISVYQVRNVAEVSTPYQGWREMYEIPSGIGLFPVSLMSHILVVFSFGMFPYSNAETVTKLAFDGMNPFMNFESEERSVTTPVSIDRKLVDTYTEQRKIPVAHAAVTLKSGDRAWPLRTNALGQVTVALLSPELSEVKLLDSRRLQLYLTEGSVLLKDIPLSRRYISRLNEGRMALLKYYDAPSGEALAECVKKLEELNFEKVSLQLEEEQLRKNRDFKIEFDAAFDR